MKETKVYVDELPESCKTCQFQCYGECRNGCDILKTDYSMSQCHIIRGKHKDCPLIDIKTHDRELVKEVCEKIARNVRVRKIQEEWYAIETDLRAALDQIQKEYEK